MLLGDTLILDTLDHANLYRQEVCGLDMFSQYSLLFTIYASLPLVKSGFDIIFLITYLPLFLVRHDVGYYGPPFFPVGSNFCASVYVHSCISGDVSQPSASLPSLTAFAINMPSVIIRCRLSCLLTCP